MGYTYREAGVDIEKADKALAGVADVINSTHDDNVLDDVGGFGGMYRLDVEKFTRPVLVAGTDGVGTKLKVAVKAGDHRTIGIDLAAMCVNDILVQGAVPLFFLDYLAMGDIRPELLEEIVEGLAAGCRQAGCVLLGGETAEMPDFFDGEEYELAGFAVGAVDEENIIDPGEIAPGHKLIGLSSSGIHSNGFTLVRKLFFEVHDYSLDDYIEDLDCQLKDALLTPTRIYVENVLKLIDDYEISGLAHITGGGLPGNIARIIPGGTRAVIDCESWQEPEIFSLIQKLGDVEAEEMYKTFNMGVGMVLTAPAEAAGEIINRAENLGEEAFLIGEITAEEAEDSAPGVELC
ncbi:phosphoribosylformylglycinamidine cyclo-ligase [Halarsenatibacter silvermanii]|uniref:Phosphoribosylformylglycinamidine cyclo-ligase n=1 Tax=Halarsenatibacter silvermanii TaxID=321763 RepID=A0A1G9PU59_9FIRM|nr:phosphoribosylformylglycinamidine cyclo-ligase [Halarsenatibacter silvermanii]SDM02308.1 phosphoribosylformylglycinamidine cyclo-ligase [Halarsenatibacter silvermanii]